MHDPEEGLKPDGTIATGASSARVPAVFAPVVDAAISAVSAQRDVSLYVYGSVATGMAVAPDSDVDLVSIGLPPDEASALSTLLSTQFSATCRSVEMGPAQPSDYQGASDEAYGNRVFLRHYCAHLAGPDRHSTLPAFAGDERAARGFNGDIGLHVARWRDELEKIDPQTLGRRLARKTLRAVAGLVSIHDHTWTTDGDSAARRWADLRPPLATDLHTLTLWGMTAARAIDRDAIEEMLNGTAVRIVDEFDSTIGLWGAPA